MSKFSQGNWYVDSANIIRCDDDYDRSIAALITSPATKEVDKANARLIAHAPDMYDDLCEIAYFLEHKSCGEHDEFAYYARIIRQTLSEIDGKEEHS